MDEDQHSILQDELTAIQTPIAAPQMTPQEIKSLMMLRAKQTEAELAARARQQQLYEEARVTKQQQLQEALDKRRGMGPDLTPVAASIDALFGTNSSAGAKANADIINKQQLKADALQSDLTNLKLLNPAGKMGGGSLDSLINGQARNELAGKRLGLMADNQASRAADTIHKNPVVLQLSQSANVLQRGLDMAAKPTLTNQEFNDMQIELGNAIAGARSAALGKLERTEYETTQGKLANITQMLSGNPQDAVPPAIKARFTELLQHTYDRINQQRSATAQSLSRTFQNNPHANTEMQKAIGNYKQPSELPAGGGTDASAQPPAAATPPGESFGDRLARIKAKKGA